MKLAGESKNIPFDYLEVYLPRHLSDADRMGNRLRTIQYAYRSVMQDILAHRERLVIAATAEAWKQ